VNEEINYSEFIAATLDKKLFLNDERLWQTFKYFDIENKNCITLDNLKEALVNFLIGLIACKGKVRT